MPFIKAKSSQASGWGWMLSMLAFPLLFHYLQDWQTKATLWGITHPRFQILNWTHPDLVAPLLNVLALAYLVTGTYYFILRHCHQAA